MSSILRDVTIGGNARFQSLLPPLLSMVPGPFSSPSIKGPGYEAGGGGGGGGGGGLDIIHAQPLVSYYKSDL